MTNKYRKVLVTGGAGCIGMPVCKGLLKKDVKVVLFDLYEQINLLEKHIDKNVEIFYGSILDDSCLRDALRGCDAIIHLAAYLGVRRTELNSLRCLDININGTKKVLDAGIQAGIQKIVFASSSEVYGEPLKNPITETDLTQGKTVYAVSKLAGEEMIKAFANEYPNLNYSILRYFNTYGPHQIAQFVVPKFIRSVLAGKSPVVYGDGSQQRSYCYSKDTSRATVEALFNDKANGEVLNVGNSDALISLTELADLVINLCGKKGKVEVITRNSFEKTDRTFSREIITRYCDTKKIINILGYYPEVSLKEGIEKVIKYGVFQPGWATSERDYTIDDSL